MRIVTAAATLAGGILLGFPAVAHAAPVCTEFGGALGGDQTCTVHTANGSYTLDMTFPVDYPDEQPLTDYLTQTRDGFINVAQMPGSRDLPYALDATSTSYTSGTPAKTRSVVLQVYQNVGGAHPLTWFKAFNYDLVKNAPITFDTLFTGPKPLEVVFPIVSRELTKQSGVDVAISAGDGLDPTHYQNFAITDDSIIFYFGQGELLPESAGATQVNVPRAAISSVLA